MKRLQWLFCEAGFGRTEKIGLYSARRDVTRAQLRSTALVCRQRPDHQWGNA